MASPPVNYIPRNETDDDYYQPYKRNQPPNQPPPLVIFRGSLTVTATTAASATPDTPETNPNQTANNRTLYPYTIELTVTRMNEDTGDLNGVLRLVLLDPSRVVDLELAQPIPFQGKLLPDGPMTFQTEGRPTDDQNKEGSPPSSQQYLGDYSTTFRCFCFQPETGSENPLRKLDGTWSCESLNLSGKFACDEIRDLHPIEDTTNEAAEIGQIKLPDSMIKFAPELLVGQYEMSERSYMLPHQQWNYYLTEFDVSTLVMKGYMKSIKFGPRASYLEILGQWSPRTGNFIFIAEHPTSSPGDMPHRVRFEGRFEQENGMPSTAKSPTSSSSAGATSAVMSASGVCITLSISLHQGQEQLQGRAAETVPFRMHMVQRGLIECDLSGMTRISEDRRADMLQYAQSKAIELVRWLKSWLKTTKQVKTSNISETRKVIRVTASNRKKPVVKVNTSKAAQHANHTSLSLVFNWLDMKDVTSCYLTCRLWRDAALSGISWKSSCTIDADETKHVVGRIVQIDLGAGDHLPVPPLKRQTRVLQITWDCFARLELMTQFAHIQILQIHMIEFGSPNEENIKQIFQHLAPSLRSLQLVIDRSDEPTGFFKLILKFLPLLTNLTLFHTSLGEECLVIPSLVSSLLSLPQLQHVLAESPERRMFDLLDERSILHLHAISHHPNLRGLGARDPWNLATFIEARAVFMHGRRKSRRMKGGEEKTDAPDSSSDYESDSSDDEKDDRKDSSDLIKSASSPARVKEFLFPTIHQIIVSDVRSASAIADMLLPSLPALNDFRFYLPPPPIFQECQSHGCLFPSWPLQSRQTLKLICVNSSSPALAVALLAAGGAYEVTSLTIRTPESSDPDWTDVYANKIGCTGDELYSRLSQSMPKLENLSLFIPRAPYQTFTCLSALAVLNCLTTPWPKELKSGDLKECLPKVRALYVQGEELPLADYCPILLTLPILEFVQWGLYPSMNPKQLFNYFTPARIQQRIAQSHVRTCLAPNPKVLLKDHLSKFPSHPPTTPQLRFRCLTCRPVYDKTAIAPDAFDLCDTCAQSCHVGHDIQSVGSHQEYCGCGNSCGGRQPISLFKPITQTTNNTTNHLTTHTQLTTNPTTPPSNHSLPSLNESQLPGLLELADLILADDATHIA